MTTSKAWKKNRNSEHGGQGHKNLNRSAESKHRRNSHRLWVEIHVYTTKTFGNKPERAIKLSPKQSSPLSVSPLSLSTGVGGRSSHRRDSNRFKCSHKYRQQRYRGPQQAECGSNTSSARRPVRDRHRRFCAYPNGNDKLRCFLPAGGQQHCGGDGPENIVTVENPNIVLGGVANNETAQDSSTRQGKQSATFGSSQVG